MVSVRINEGGLSMIDIEGGYFLMGNNAGNDIEKPVHKVFVSDFYISEFLVRQTLYENIMKRNPSKEKSSTLPAENISWLNAIKFCNALSIKEDLNPYYIIEEESVTLIPTAKGYRLPTEAEWEYAAGGGNKNRTMWAGTNHKEEVSDYAWYLENSEGRIHPVGQKKPNTLGLYDMSGNVWEWCWDWCRAYSSKEQKNPLGPPMGLFHVVRGGSWYCSVDGCRVTFRCKFAFLNNLNIGFRLAQNK